jgi:hypothetical protein
MKLSNTFGRAAAIMAAAGALQLAASPAAHGQIGAIAAAPGGAMGGTELTTRGPVVTESALTLPRGAWTGSATVGVTGGSGFSGVDYDFTYSQMLLGVFFGLSDDFTIGATVFPYTGFEIEALGLTDEQTGHGDATLYAKYRLLGSNDTRTSVAVAGALGLPLGDELFGAEGTVLGVVGIVSHNLDRLALHASAGARIPTDEYDGETALIFTGAAVYPASPKLSLSLELIGSRMSTEFATFRSVELAPAARFAVARNIFLTGALQFNVSSEPFDAAYDYAVMLGASMTR